MQPPRFAIFDLDGTLIDTEPCYTRATQEIVSRFGKSFPWELKARMMGQPALHSARLLVQELQLPISAEQYLAEREPRLVQLMGAAPDLPGVDRLLPALRERGVRLAIATSSKRAMCKQKLQHRSWAQHIEVVVCGDDPEVGRGKPAPDIFLHAASLLTASPAESVVFEDAPTGMQAALAAGMRLVAVPDARLDHRLIPEGALVIDSLASLDLKALGL